MTTGRIAFISISTLREFEECISTLAQYSGYWESNLNGSVSIVRNMDGTLSLSLKTTFRYLKPLPYKPSSDLTPNAKP